MFAAGAVLGPLCDGQHSSHDVLHYHQPAMVPLGPFGVLETCWWVPLLFGVAGVILGVSVPLLDQVVASSGTDGRRHPVPSWTIVYLCIAAFVVQYALSGALEGPLLGSTLGWPTTSPLGGDPSMALATTPLQVPTLDVVLGVFALAHWALFDRSLPGALMSTLTALCGPLIEVALINGPHLYHYEHPAVWGIPTFLPAVYFCGGPAVGNLGRRVWADLKSQQAAAQ